MTSTNSPATSPSPNVWYRHLKCTEIPQSGSHDGGRSGPFFLVDLSATQDIQKEHWHLSFAKGRLADVLAEMKSAIHLAACASTAMFLQLTSALTVARYLALFR